MRTKSEKVKAKLYTETEKHTKDNKEMLKLQRKAQESGTLPQYKIRKFDVEVKELTILAFQLQSSSKQN